MKNALHMQNLCSRLEWLIDSSILAVVFFLPLSLDMTTASLVIGMLVWLGKMLLLRTWELRRLPFDTLLALLVLFGSFSIAASPDRFFSLYNYVHLMGRYILLYYLVSHNIKSQSQLSRVVIVLLTSAVLVSLYGFYQYIIGVDTSALEWVDGDQFPDLKVRIFSTLQNPNLLAGFLVTVIAIATGLGLRFTENDKKLSMLVLVVMLTGCLVLTYSRGAWVSMAVVIGAYGLLYDRRFLWLLLIGPAVMLCFSEVSSRVLSIFHPTDTSSTLRLALWESTVAMIRDNPLSGIGWGSYWLVYPNYDFFIQDPSTVIFHAHNMYLHLAAETGLPGMCTFIAFMYCHAHTALRLLPQAEEPWIQGLLSGLVAAILGIAVSGLTDHILFSIQMSMLVWLMFAIVIAIKQLDIGIPLKKTYSTQQENLHAGRIT